MFEDCMSHPGSYRRQSPRESGDRAREGKRRQSLAREDAPLQRRNLLHQCADLVLQLLDATRRKSRLLGRRITLSNRLLEGQAMPSRLGLCKRKRLTTQRRFPPRKRARRITPSGSGFWLGWSRYSLPDAPTN